VHRCTTTATTTTTRDKGDRYGPIEWAQLMTLWSTELHIIHNSSNSALIVVFTHVMSSAYYVRFSSPSTCSIFVAFIILDCLILLYMDDSVKA